MDDITLLKSAGVSTTTIVIVFALYKLFKSVLGKKVVSSCCGRKMEMGIDVTQMTPTPMTENPIRVVVPDPA
jgi:hypothetical protein